MNRIKRFVQVGCLLAFAVAAAQAAVDLEWRVENDFIQVGDTVRVGLYAVADNEGQNELFGALEAILNWDPDALALLGYDDDGPYQWGLIGFDEGDYDGLNDTFDDGDAYFGVLGRFDESPAATVEGLLVATIEFEAIAPADATELSYAEEFGEHSQTAVWDIGFNIVDDLDVETIEINEGGLPGDVDGDGDVDISDLALLLGAYGSCEGDSNYNAYADFDEDGCVGLMDLSVLLSNYGR